MTGNKVVNDRPGFAIGVSRRVVTCGLYSFKVSFPRRKAAIWLAD